MSNEIIVGIKKGLLDPNNKSSSINKLLAYRMLWALMGKPARIVPTNIPTGPLIVDNDTLDEAQPG